MKDRRTGNENFGAGPHDVGNRIGIDAAINFDDTPIIPIFNKLPGFTNFFHSLGNEGLPAEARIHGHDEQDIGQRHGVLHVSNRCRRVN